MGNHRFRLSDMIPNAWFYKLKDISSRTRNQNIKHSKKKKPPPTSSSSSSSSSLSPSSTTPAIPPLQQSKTEQPHHLLSHQRKSHYFTRELTPHDHDTHFPDFPRKSSKQRRSTTRRKNRASDRPSPRLVSVTACVSAGRNCPANLDSVWTKPDSTSEDYPNSPPDSSSDPESLLPELGSDHDPILLSDSFEGMVSWSSSCHCRVENDIVIDVIDESLNTKFDGFNSIAELELPPIITKKPAKSQERNVHGSLSVKEDNLASCIEQRTSPVRRLSVSSPGVRLRTNSPRIANRKIQASGRKSVSSGSRSRRSLSESFAVVKSSADPQRDFKESMVEMILENNLRASKDLEDLLACYLQLNSDEYHETIIKVFKQIWFDLADVRLK